MKRPRRLAVRPYLQQFRSPSFRGHKLCIICSKVSLDMAYPGLVLANAALEEGIETHLFFTVGIST